MAPRLKKRRGMLLTPETKRAVWNIRWRLGATVGLMMAAALVALAVREAREARPRARPPYDEPTRLDRTRSVSAGMVVMMVEPLCILGPAALCARIRSAVVACADGSAGPCWEVAQYLESTPPYPTAVMFFYQQGCRLGDAKACARQRSVEFHRQRKSDCDVDRLACAVRARRDGDLAALEHLCTRGVGDACGALSAQHAAVPALERKYLVAACQAGNPMACNELAWRQAPDCDGEACFAPEAAQAAMAATVACEAGFTRLCASLSR